MKEMDVLNLQPQYLKLTQLLPVSTYSTQQKTEFENIQIEVLKDDWEYRKEHNRHVEHFPKLHHTFNWNTLKKGEKEWVRDIVEERMVENFPKHMKDNDSPIQEAQRTKSKNLQSKKV